MGLRARGGLCVAVVGAVGLLAPAAHAATVEVVNGTAVFTAAPGEHNDVRAGTLAIPDGRTLRIDDAGAPLTAGPGCRRLAVGSVWCPEATPGALALSVSTGDENDQVFIDDSVFRTVTVHGGTGDDTIHVGNSVGTPAVLDGGAGDDQLSTAMNSSDTPVLRGGSGDDVLTILEGGGAQASGGAGNDRIVYVGAPFRQVVRLDGGSGNDTYTFPDHIPAGSIVPSRGFDTLDQSTVTHALNFDMSTCPGCVERVIGTALDDQIVGDASPQAIFGGAGNDALDGGGGPDFISGQAGDDTIASQDGVFDFVGCGDGTDSVVADGFDFVLGDCETVTRGG
jgi:Ca2+-binding RTX toxin-like protein